MKNSKNQQKIVEYLKANDGIATLSKIAKELNIQYSSVKRTVNSSELLHLVVLDGIYEGSAAHFIDYTFIHEHIRFNFVCLNGYLIRCNNYDPIRDRFFAKYKVVDELPALIEEETPANSKFKGMGTIKNYFFPQNYSSAYYKNDTLKEKIRLLIENIFMDHPNWQLTQIIKNIEKQETELKHIPYDYYYRIYKKVIKDLTEKGKIKAIEEVVFKTTKYKLYQTI